jgi:hypothetical protein
MPLEAYAITLGWGLLGIIIYLAGLWCVGAVTQIATRLIRVEDDLARAIIFMSTIFGMSIVVASIIGS